MQKTFRQTALAIGLGLAGLASSAFSATTSSTFDVSLKLTPRCDFVGTIGVLSVDYESFQPGAATNKTSFNMRCTTGQSFTVALDGDGSYKDSTTNLDYTLKLSPNATSLAGGETATLNGTGSGTTQLTYYVYADVAGGQVGQGGSKGMTFTGTTTRTLTITY